MYVCHPIRARSACLLVSIMIIVMSLAKRAEPALKFCLEWRRVCGPKEPCIRWGVHIGATWRIRWIDLCGSGAGCRYHCRISLFSGLLSDWALLAWHRRCGVSVPVDRHQPWLGARRRVRPTDRLRPKHRTSLRHAERYVRQWKW